MAEITCYSVRPIWFGQPDLKDPVIRKPAIVMLESPDNMLSVGEDGCFICFKMLFRWFTGWWLSKGGSFHATFWGWALIPMIGSACLLGRTDLVRLFIWSWRNINLLQAALRRYIHQNQYHGFDVCYWMILSTQWTYSQRFSGARHIKYMGQFCCCFGCFTIRKFSHTSSQPK